MTYIYKIIQPGYFNIAVTALLEEYGNKLVTGMFKKGYTVAPALKDNSLVVGYENRPSVLIVFRVYTGDSGATIKTVSDHLSEVIIETGLFVHSYVVTEDCSAMFCGSNINLSPKTQSSALPSVPPDTLRKMN